jgi:hypothetical protein
MTWLYPILMPTLLLLAADEWKSKPVSQWTPADAKQVLASSGWVKAATVGQIQLRSEAQLREGGKMGGGARRPKNDGGSTDGNAPQTLQVRWESAKPIRSAEVIAADSDAPQWDGDYYVLAVYGVPGLTGNPKALASDFKRTASLKGDTNKELKPVRVDVVVGGNRMATVVYFFPRTADLASNKIVTFTAQIGRMAIAPNFDREEMRLQGNVEM